MEGRAFFSGSFTYIDKNVGENWDFRSYCGRSHIRSSRSVIFHVNDVEVFDRLLSLIRSGYPLQAALKMLGEGIRNTESDIVFCLQRLERRIEELEKENYALRDIVQKYLAEIEKLKGLPPPRKSWREKIKEWFSRMKRYNQTKAGD